MKKTVESMLEELKESIKENNRLWEEAEQRRIEEKKKYLKQEITRLEEELKVATMYGIVNVPKPNYIEIPIGCPCMKYYFKKEN